MRKVRKTPAKGNFTDRAMGLRPILQDPATSLKSFDQDRDTTDRGILRGENAVGVADTEPDGIRDGLNVQVRDSANLALTAARISMMTIDFVEEMRYVLQSIVLVRDTAIKSSMKFATSSSECGCIFSVRPGRLSANDDVRLSSNEPA